MIGSFWNLCRACPSMPVDKLHSEYRSTYRWHEYTGPRQEVVRRAPQGGHTNATHSDEKRHDFGNATRMDEESHELPKLEPALPRRKKHPDLAYRHHEFIVSDRSNATASHDATDNNADRARSEERGVSSHWGASRRSKSEGPARPIVLMNGQRRRDSDPDLEDTHMHTGHTSRRDAAGADSAPRKSQSMGALKPAANAMIHRKRAEFEPRDGTASELEPLVNESNTIREETNGDVEYKKPYNVGEKRHFKKPIDQIDEAAKHLLQNGSCVANGGNEWYKEVVELRKKAGEYKNRGWGSKVVPVKATDIYNKQVELWDEVSRRSSLSALSLASTAHRSYTKEEKDEENAKKSSPTKALRNAENSAKMIKDIMRHHLERTTGGSEFDGLILSPTREKLEPTIPKRDDDSRGSQKNSPKKNSPQKTALQKKNSLKSKSALRTARSQSVGHTDMSSSEKRSPKRQSRSATVKEKKTTPSSATAPSTAVAVAPSTTNNVPVTKRPRPSSLNTTASSRYKSSSVPPKLEEERSAKTKPIKTNHSETNTHNSKESRKGNSSATEPTRHEKITPIVSEPEPIDLEPIIKSPPEPTRVKSPEQIIMRSPDPVNWTVPLDTGKTFTVTQNVREGDLASRPHSEVQKPWTPPEIPLPVAQSAPPQLTEHNDQAREHLEQQQQLLTPNLDSSSTTSSVISIKDAVAGLASTADCIDTTPVADSSAAIAPSFPPSSPFRFPEDAIAEEAAASSGKSLAAGVLEKARNRFDHFWRNNSQDEHV